MRSSVLCVLLAAVGVLAGCGSDDTNNCVGEPGCIQPDASTPMCTPGEPGCPNMGVPNTTGSCEDQPGHSVDCQDGFCWVPGTDCGMEEYACGEVTFRCAASSQSANCCDGEVQLCPSNQVYCPDEGRCSTECSAPTDRCAFRGGACN